MLLEGKTGLILGVANKRSIAWGIARACAREGARLALTYQGERLKENVDELSKDLKEPLLYPCDVARDEATRGCWPISGCGCSVPPRTRTPRPASPR